MQILDGNLTVGTDTRLAPINYEEEEQRSYKLEQKSESPVPLQSKTVGKPSEKGTLSTRGSNGTRNSQQVP